MRAAALLALIAGSAVAAPVAEWRGPTEAACHGRCPVEDTLAHLAARQRAQFRAAHAADPAGRPTVVATGDVCLTMAYHDGHAARVDARGVVADVEHPWPARAWPVDGGEVLLIDACSNWCFRAGGAAAQIAGDRDSPRGTAAGNVGIANQSGPAHRIVAGWGAHSRPIRRESGHFAGNVDAPTPPVGETPAPIPLPAGAWLLLTALGVLGWRAAVARGRA